MTISYAEILERQITAPNPTVEDQIATLDEQIGLLLQLKRARDELRRADLNGSR